jgi:hypothetical protein
LSALAVFGLFTACSDSGGASGDALTTAELSELTGTLMEPMFDLLFGPTLAAPMIPRAASAPVSDNIECDEGGSLSISGDISDTESGGGTVDLTETINSCEEAHGEVVFTMVGDPNITMTGSGDDTSGSLSINGGFTYTATDGRTGSCGVDVDATLTGTTISFDGSICGVDVDLLTDDIVIAF